MRRQIYLQQGQGMVGFLVAVSLLVIPAALAINYLARIGDAKHKSYEAARYAVWERTVWHQNSTKYNRKSDVDIQREITTRIFGRQNAPISSTQDKQKKRADTIEWDTNLYAWERANGKPRPTIVAAPAKPDDEQIFLKMSDSSAPGNFSGVINRVASTALGLDRNGFYNANVHFELHRDRHLVNALNAAVGNSGKFEAQSGNAMLVGAWNANGPDDVRRTVRRTMPTSFLDSSLMDALLNAASVAGFKELRELDFGYVDPERVPCQRLRRSGGGGLGC